MRHASEPLIEPGSWTGPVLTTISFVLLLLLVVLHHEPWRDEVELRTLVETLPTLRDVTAAVKCGGHPLLWPFLLFGLWRLTGIETVLRVFQLAFSAATVFLIARFAPLHRLQKILLCFSYFLLYEYAVIFRAYGLGVFFLVAACVLFVRRRSPLLFAAAISLAAQTSVYALILAVAMALAWLIREPSCIRSWRGRAAAGIFLAAVVSSSVQMKPPPDGAIAPGWILQPSLWRIGWTASRLWTSYVPIPAAGPRLWNTNILGTGLAAPALLSAALFGLAVALIAPRKSALVILLVSTGGVLLFTYVKFGGSLRHHGHLFIALILAWWIGESERPFSAVQRLFLTALLAAHCGAGIWLALADIALPFSRSSETAAFIASRFDAATPIVAYPDSQTSPIACLLRRPVYFPERKRWGTFMVWNNRKWPVSRSQLIDCVSRIAEARRADVLLLLREDIELPPNPFKLIDSFESGMIIDEGYRIYLCRYGAGASKSRR